MIEIWRAVADFDAYEVSNLGNIRSIDRIVRTRFGTRKAIGKIIRSCYSSLGYEMVSFNRKGMLVHRLVATAFIPNPKNKPRVNHLDLCRSNNVVSNLEWATHSEDVQHAWNTNKHRKPMGPTKLWGGKTSHAYWVWNMRMMRRRMDCRGAES